MTAALLGRLTYNTGYWPAVISRAAHTAPRTGVRSPFSTSATRTILVAVDCAPRTVITTGWPTAVSATHSADVQADTDPSPYPAPMLAAIPPNTLWALIAAVTAAASPPIPSSMIRLLMVGSVRDGGERGVRAPDLSEHPIGPPFEHVEERSGLQVPGQHGQLPGGGQPLGQGVVGVP